MVENKYKNLKDEEILRLIGKKKEVYAVLIRRYEQKIMGYVRKIGGGTQENVEDIVQNIFIKAYVNINGFKKGHKYSSWLYGIAHNECIDYWRKHKKHKNAVSLDGNEELSAILASDEDLSENTIGKMESLELRRTLNDLPAKYREILVLRYLEDKTYEDMAEILKKPVSTIGTLVRRAKSKIKEELEKEKYGSR